MEQPQFGQNPNPNSSPVQNFLSASFLPFLKKNQKWLFILLGLAILIGFIYLVGYFLHDPEGMINDFETAVRTGKVDDLEDIVVNNTDGLKMDKKQLQQFIQYAQSNPKYFTRLMASMRAQYHFYEGEPWNVGIDAPKDYLSYGDYYLVHQDRSLFYDSYEIAVRPYYVTIETNEPDAVVKVDGKQVFKTNANNMKHVMGPVMPGTYQVLVEKNFEFAVLSSNEEIQAFDRSPQTVEADLSLSGENIYVESEFDDTRILVNGRDTKKTTGTTERFGPISRNGTVKIQGVRTFPWGEERSLEQVIEENTSSFDLTPVAFQTPESKTKATETINNFFKSEMSALVSQDISKLTNATDNMKKKYTEDINSLKDWERYWKGSTLGTRIDYSKAIIKMNKETNTYEISIPVEVHYRAKRYSSYDRGKEDPLEETYDEFHVHLSYQESSKTWLVNDLSSDYFGGGSNYMQSPLVVKSEFK
ncbi:TcaA 3rd/4th domain-containing protein [Risungbinella massiliensis]|uniref:TcaA 3rd/4th domain-containing protein n=1 Tax=Risungbinella massiliensis TaxID=1329796 RepID=UPI0005CC8814|nr:hypothetical protein [Risungbinella massiliensis]